MDEYEYRRNRDHDNESEGMITNYERQRYNGIRPVFSDEGKHIPIKYQLEEESELYGRFGSSSGNETKEDTETIRYADSPREASRMPPGIDKVDSTLR